MPNLHKHSTVHFRLSNQHSLADLLQVIVDLGIADQFVSHNFDLTWLAELGDSIAYSYLLAGFIEQGHSCSGSVSSGLQLSADNF